MSQWNYIKITLNGQEQVGPVSSAELFEAIVEGHVKKETRVSSETVTFGKWVVASQVPSVLEMFANIETAKETQATKKDPPTGRECQEREDPPDVLQGERDGPEDESKRSSVELKIARNPMAGLTQVLDEHQAKLNEIQASISTIQRTFQFLLWVVIVVAILLGIDVALRFSE